MKDDLIITKVSWVTKRPGVSKPPEFFKAVHWTLVEFLQTNNLTTRELAKSINNIDDDFEIRQSDLNELGYRTIKNGLSKWFKNIDQGGVPTNTLALKRGLELAKKQ